MKKRLLFLTQCFDPEPTPRGLEFARELMRNGFEVEVITGFPNYPEGKLYPGYRIKLIQREEIDGVHITRLPLYPSHSSFALARILNYASFAASALFYGLFWAQLADVIYIYNSPITVGISASLIRLFRRIPVIYDIQDIWPDTLQATGMFNNKYGLIVVGWVCSWVYRRIDQIVVPAPGFKRLLIERNVPEYKIKVIYNWCEESQLTNVNAEIPKDFPDGSYFRIVFAGNIGKAQALGSVIEAAAIIATSRSTVRFVFIGGGVEVDSLKAIASEKQLNNIVFIPRMPMNQVGSALKAADVLLVHLKRDPLFAITIPSKTQAYMAMGKPILMAVPGDAAALVSDAKCGVLAESENPQSIADAVCALQDVGKSELEFMGKLACDYYQRALSLNVGCSNIVALLNKSMVCQIKHTSK